MIHGASQSIHIDYEETVTVVDEDKIEKHSQEIEGE